MALFDCWTENSAQMHVASDTPIAWRRLRPAIFSAAFDQWQLGLVLSGIRSDNVKSLAAAEHLGFTEVARIRDAVSVGVDLVLVEARQRRSAAEGQ